MKLLQQQLHNTLLYFDMFDFAPTLLELEKWLITKKYSTQKLQLSTLQKALSNDPRITEKEGFFFINGRKQLVQKRKTKYNFTDKKWKHARPFLRLIALMPGVQGIWLTNSMGWGNAQKNSDVDLFIITAPGKIWTTRFFTTALMKIFQQRPHEQDEEKAICLSMYLSANHLNIETYKIGKEDIHFTYWSNQIYPIYDTGQFEQFQGANPWLNDAFEKIEWIHPIERRKIQLSWPEHFLKKAISLIHIEKTLQRIQLHILPEKIKKMANEDNRVVINDNILKLHTNDKRSEQQQQWKQKINEYTQA